MGDAAAAALRRSGGRAAEAGVSVEVGTDRKLKRLLELANKLEARFTLIVGDNEIAASRMR